MSQVEGVTVRNSEERKFHDSVMRYRMEEKSKRKKFGKPPAAAQDWAPCGFRKFWKKIIIITEIRRFHCR